jgi:hypothetical protein
MWVVDERVERNASLCMGIVDQGDGIPPDVESRRRGTGKRPEKLTILGEGVY